MRHSAAGSRAGSVPPNRYAPDREVDTNLSPTRMRSGSPGSRAYWDAHKDQRGSKPHSPGMQAAPNSNWGFKGNQERVMLPQGRSNQMQESRPHSPGMQNRNGFDQVL